jgi:hypothetical protein
LLADIRFQNHVIDLSFLPIKFIEIVFFISAIRPAREYFQPILKIVKYGIMNRAAAFSARRILSIFPEKRILVQGIFKAV